MIATHLLHAFVWTTVHVTSPRRAIVLGRAVGGMLPPLSVQQASRLNLRGGTCLTRALTVASRVRGARVAIGASTSSAGFRAHAWVETDGVPLRIDEEAHQALAKL
jgi:hypothetical protein